MNDPTTSGHSLPDVKSVTLPIMGHSAQALHQALSETVTPWATVGRIILHDPALTLHVLRQVIGNRRNSLRSDAVSMRQAAMLLGVDWLNRLAQSLPRLETSLPPAAQEGYRRVLSRSYHAAFHAADWLTRKHDMYPEEIFVAAFLHDLSEMALWAAASDRMLEMEQMTRRQGIARDEAEYLILGDSTEHFAREMAEFWQLPALIHDSLRPENTPNMRVRGVVLANQLAQTCEAGWDSDDTLRVIGLIADFLEEPVEQTAAHLHEQAASAARESYFYGVQHPAALLVLASEAQAQPAAENGAAPVVEVSGRVCLVPQRERLLTIMKELHAGAATLDTSAVVRKLLHGLHEGIGLNRAVFYMLSHDGKSLEPRFMIGTDSDPAFNLFRLRLGMPHLFTHLLGKTQSVWINDENRERFWKLVPRDFKDLIRVDAFFARSVHLDNRPLGVIYADRHSTDCLLTQASYDQFRQLCQLAATALNHSLARPRPGK